MASNNTDLSVPYFEKGDVLEARHLNRIVEQSEGRVVGADGVLAGAVGRSVTLRGRKLDRRPAPGTIVATLGAPTTDEVAEEGEYLWERFEGGGPESGRCIELNQTVGLPAGETVLLHRAAGIWYFQWIGAVRYKVTAIGDNTLTVQLLENATEGGAGDTIVSPAQTFTIWKPHHLQRQTYQGVVNGITYTYVGVQMRTAAASGFDTETQIIAEPYFVGCIVDAGRVANGAAKGASRSRLTDLNRQGRGWYTQPEEE